MKNTDESAKKYEEKIANLEARIGDLTHQLDWFKRQLFGKKSEKRFLSDLEFGTKQLSLNLGFQEEIPAVERPQEVLQTIPTHTRRKIKSETDVLENGLRFDDSVPVEVIELAPQEYTENKDLFDVVSIKSSYRLAQKPAMSFILQYNRLTVKKKETQALLTAPAPFGVLGKASVDVSFLATMLIEKFLYHLPLYRQHQRLLDAKITLSRVSLTNWSNQCAQLFKPIYEAQKKSVLQSKVLAIDETPIKVGRDPDKKEMKTGWIWPMYGDRDEIVFQFSTTRGADNLKNWLHDFNGTLLTDGYAAYEKFAKSTDLEALAQCWAHTRRGFENAKTVHADVCNQALDQMGDLYKIEKEIRENNLSGEAKKEIRQTKSAPIVERFFSWCEQQEQKLPKDPLTKALNYALKRKENLRVFLSNPDVAIDTNHLERRLRVIPMGKKNWLFCWTEIGAETLAMVQTLLVTCRMQGVDPYTYFVDVLQRIAVHPANRIEDLLPRNWKRLFADNPFRSDLDLLAEGFEF